jgi:hypothetical protein
MRKSVALCSGSELVANRDRFRKHRDSHRKYLPHVADQFFKVAICDLKDRPRPQS